MDAINQAIAQLTELFRNMSAGSRLTAGLLLVVAVVSIGYLFNYQVTGGDDFLFNGASIRSEDLNKMELAFGKAQLNAYTIVGSRIKVPHSVRSQYMGALADAGALPKGILSEVIESTNSSPIDTPSQRAERLKVGLERELSTIVGSMQGMESASVFLSEVQQPADFQNPLLKSAMVYVRTPGSAPIDNDQGKKICYLVAGAWAGLKVDNVTVLDQNGGLVHFDPNESSGQTQYQSAVTESEQRLRKMVMNALSYIRGVTVTPKVVLDTKKYEQTRGVKHDPKTIPLKTFEESTTNSSETAPPGGQPGVEINQPRSLGQTAGNPVKPLTQQSEKSKNESLNTVSSTTTISENVGLTPLHESVSIGIPTSYYENVWLQRNPPKPGEEAKKPEQAALDTIRTEVEANVKKAIAPLLMASGGQTDTNELVTVMSFQDIKVPEIASAPITSTAASWFDQNWRTLAIGGLVIVSLMMLRSMIRSIPQPEPEVASARISAEETTDSKEEPAEATAARRLRRMNTSGPSLRDELSELVKEDPDSAANILRAWIGQVA
jgi:flagellar M-ring protein FliF